MRRRCEDDTATDAAATSTSEAAATPAPSEPARPTGDCEAADEDCQIGALREFARKLCACGSKRLCAEEVIGQMKQWGTLMAQRRGPNHVFTESYQQRVEEVWAEMDDAHRIERIAAGAAGGGGAR